MKSCTQIFLWFLIAACSVNANPNYNLSIKIEHSGEADGTYTLGCSPPTGTHPSVTAACQAIETAVSAGVKPFSNSTEDQVCTMQYGGPNTATVTGTWAGAKVNAVFRRTNGCEISRWNQLATLFMTNQQ